MLVGTADDVVALTHLWWMQEGPAEAPYAPDPEQLRQQRERLLELATLIVPGHGAPFRLDASLTSWREALSRHLCHGCGAVQHALNRRAQESTRFRASRVQMPGSADGLT